jgi:hypothetical protein
MQPLDEGTSYASTTHTQNLSLVAHGRCMTKVYWPVVDGTAVSVYFDCDCIQWDKLLRVDVESHAKTGL